MATNSVSLMIRKKFFKSYIWSVALYEKFTIDLAKNRLKAIEMWCFEKMLKIPWIGRVTNEEVLNKIKEKRQLWKSIQSRRDKMIGHILRNRSLLKTIIEGDIQGQIGKRKLRKYMTQIMKDIDKEN